MPVFIPETDHLALQARLYVVCMPLEGRLSPRVVAMENVFFYSDFWEGVSRVAKLARLQRGFRKTRPTISRTATMLNTTIMTPNSVDSANTIENPLHI
jgi:hypothetical protein